MQIQPLQGSAILNRFHIKTARGRLPFLRLPSTAWVALMVMWQADGEAKSATKVCANADPHEGQTSDQQGLRWLEEVQRDDDYDVFIYFRILIQSKRERDTRYISPG